MGLLVINGQAVTPNPSNIDLGKFTLSKSGRAASGLMLMDIIAYKDSMTATWDMIPDADLGRILQNLRSKTFHSVEYPDAQAPGGRRTMTAYVGDIEMGLWHRVGGVRYWTNVSIPLIER